MELQVKHNLTENNFTCRPCDTEAVLSYSRKHRALSVERIFLPTEFEDSELKEELIKAVFRYCRRNNLKLIPNQADVKEFVEANPQYEPLVQQDTGPGKGAEFLRLG